MKMLAKGVTTKKSPTIELEPQMMELLQKFTQLRVGKATPRSLAGINSTHKRKRC